MTTLNEIVNTILKISKMLGDVVEEDKVDTSEDVKEGCINVEYVDNIVDKIEKPRDLKKFWGLDASIRTLKLTGIDIIIVSGALVGSRLYIEPKIIDTRWICIRPRCKASEDLKQLLENLSYKFYTKSRLVDRVFDGTYSEEVLQDELRVSMENSMIKLWDRTGILIIDGPLFHAPRIISSIDNIYAKVYIELTKERLNLLKGFEDKVVCIVKRLSQCRYLARLECVGATDDYVAIIKANKILKRREVSSVFIGTLRLSISVQDYEFEKYMGYIVSRAGDVFNVIRIETLDLEFLYDIKDYIAQILTPSGVPKTIELADKLCKKVSSSIFTILWNIAPLSPTYEGFESLLLSLKDLQE